MAGDGATVLAQLQIGSRSELQAAGTSVVIPARLLPLTQVRDLTASARLRSVTPAAARVLLRAARADFPALAETVTSADVAKMSKARRAVHDLLGPQAHPRLVDGVLGLSLLAAVLEGEEPAAPTPPPPSQPGRPADPVSDRQLAAAVAGLAPYLQSYYGRNQVSTMFDDLHRADLALARRDTGAAAAAEPVGLLGRLGRAFGKAKASVSSPWHEPEPQGFAGTGAVLGLLPLLPAMAYRVALSTTTEADRHALLQFFDAWRASGLSVHLSALRYATVNYPADVDAPVRSVLTTPHSRYVFGGGERWSSRDGRGGRVSFLERFDDAPQLPAGAQAVYDFGFSDGWGRADQVASFVTAATTHPALGWSAEACDQLRADTGLSSASAALILAGLPALDSAEHNFLDRELRETLGLKAADAASARDQLRTLTAPQRISLMAAVAGDPSRLWDEPSQQRAARAATWWVSTFGRQVVLDDKVVQLAKSYTVYGNTASALAEAVTAPDQSSLLTVGPEPLPGHTLISLAALAVSVGHGAPVADPQRLSAGRALQRLRDLCHQPDCYIALGSMWLGRRELDLERLPTIRSPFPVVYANHTVHDAGVLLFTRNLDRPTDSHLMVHLRPALLGSPSAELVQLNASYEPQALEAIDWLTGADCADLISDLTRTDLAPGTSTTDPRAVTAELVAEVGQRLGVGEDAAALYLQLLALPTPTTKTLTTANGWTPNRLKTVAAELTAQELVVAGKRARAQREYFLPGGWADLKSPDLPLEDWKLGLFKAWVRTIEGPVVRSVHMFPLGHPLVTTSSAEHFRRAWQRIVDGDLPGATPPLRQAGERPAR